MIKVAIIQYNMLPHIGFIHSITVIKEWQQTETLSHNTYLKKTFTHA